MKLLYFFLSVLVTIAIGNSIIIFADSDSKVIYSNWILIINSLIAAGLSLYILIKDKKHAGHDKENILLTIGLIFWLIANIIWAYYELILDIVSPVPSLADFFLLSAYVFLIYRLMIIRNNLGHILDKKIMFVIIFLTGLFLVYILTLTLNLAETSNFRGLMLFIVTIAYPVLNSILTILAITILLGIRNDKHHLVPWVCEIVGFLAIVVGDSWFAIIVLTTFVEQLWISALLLSAHYLLIASGLIWYMRYSIKWKSKDVIFKIAVWTRNRTSKHVILMSITSVSLLLLFFGFYISIGFNGDEKNSLLVMDNKKYNAEKPLISTTVGQINHKEFVVGAIVPMTGSSSSMGKTVKVALEKAENDVNKYFEMTNSSSRFNLVIANSKSSSEDSLEAIKQLHSFGAKIIVGPATVLQFQLRKNMQILMTSYLSAILSTSPLLSIEGDNLLRFVPDDINQGKIIAQRMIDDGIKVIVPIWRGDIYGNELYNATTYHFEKLGGKVEEGINYKPHTGKFATSLHRINFIMWNQDFEKLNNLVSNAIKKYGKESVGVYIISYDEITPILIQSRNYQTLENVRWYGSDSIAENHHLTKNIDSAVFAIKTNLSNPLYSIDTKSSNKFHELKEEIEMKLPHPDSITYSAIAYDSFWISSLSLDKNSTNNYSDKKNNTKSFKDIVIATSESFDNGISGKIKLNEAGDRIGGNYDFWIVSKDDHNNEHYGWKVEDVLVMSNNHR